MKLTRILFPILFASALMFLAYLSLGQTGASAHANTLMSSLSPEDEAVSGALIPTMIYTVTKTADTNDGVCNADCSLREAIIAANGSPGEDAIWLPAGLYILSLPGVDEDEAATGDLDITEGVIITGSGVFDTVIDGGGIDRVFENHGDVTMTGLSIQNGIDDRWGAGIFQFWGTLTLDHIEIKNNMGAGIWIELAAELRLSNAVIQENENPDGPGGGLIIAADLCKGCVRTIELTNVTVISNTAAYGGGINIGDYSKVILDHVTIMGNEAVYDGGGIHNSGGVITMTNSIVANNVAGEDGGGIANRIQYGLMLITNSTISGNAAQRGGGFSSKFTGHAEFYNTTIAQNSATELGGGVAILDGLIFTDTYPYGGIITLTHTIMAGNTGTPSPDCVITMEGEFASTGYNLIGSNEGCDFPAATGDMLDIVPQLSPLQNNGGPTLTHALLPNSPAIDAGNPAGCTDAQGNPLLTDQRGFTRPQDGNRDGNALCDIGAFEYAPASLTLNYPNGAPGSYFTVTGANFSPNVSVTLSINGIALGSILSDENCGFELLLSTDNADEGYYSLTASATTSATVQFTLDAALPARPQEGSGEVFEVPAGVAFTVQVFLPVIRR